MSNSSPHKHCVHPATKSARAECRRKPHVRRWMELIHTVKDYSPEWHALLGAEENAIMTFGVELESNNEEHAMYVVSGYDSNTSYENWEEDYR